MGRAWGRATGQLRRAAGRDYEAFATGAGSVIGTKRELAATRATASNRSMKISASMAVSPK